jgi:hypothetical protein
MSDKENQNKTRGQSKLVSSMNTFAGIYCLTMNHKIYVRVLTTNVNKKVQRTIKKHGPSQKPSSRNINVTPIS